MLLLRPRRFGLASAAAATAAAAAAAAAAAVAYGLHRVPLAHLLAPVPAEATATDEAAADHGQAPTDETPAVVEGRPMSAALTVEEAPPSPPSPPPPPPPPPEEEEAKVQDARPEEGAADTKVAPDTSEPSRGAAEAPALDLAPFVAQTPPPPAAEPKEAPGKAADKNAAEKQAQGKQVAGTQAASTQAADKRKRRKPQEAARAERRAARALEQERACPPSESSGQPFARAAPPSRDMALSAAAVAALPTGEGRALPPRPGARRLPGNETMPLEERPPTRGPQRAIAPIAASARAPGAVGAASAAQAAAQAVCAGSTPLPAAVSQQDRSHHAAASSRRGAPVAAAPAPAPAFPNAGSAPGRPAPGWSPLAPCSGAAASAVAMIDPLQGWRSQTTTRSAETHTSREHRAPPSTQRPQSSFAAAAGSSGAAATASTTTTAAANRSAASGSRRGREENLPAAFICPITQELMEEPVVTQDGQTYERHAIEYWLRDHDTSPLTGQPLAHKELTANIVLRSMIREHYERHR